MELEFIDSIENRNPNTIFLDGYICKEPVYRTTPLGREIADVLLTVNRAYGKSDYIPCICWGRNARYAGNLTVGSRIQLRGRIQSREYQKRIGEGKVVDKIAYEVSAKPDGIHRGGRMKKIEIDIPLEAYTDNVRRIIERSLHDLEAEPPYLTSFLCDPKLTEEDLETALHILEKAGTELTKQKFIRAELEARKEVVNPEVFPEDLRKDWEDMRKAAERRRKR